MQKSITTVLMQVESHPIITWNLSWNGVWGFTWVRGLKQKFLILIKLTILCSWVLFVFVYVCSWHKVYYSIAIIVSLYLKLFLKKSFLFFVAFKLLYHANDWHFLCFRLTNTQLSEQLHVQILGLGLYLCA